MPLRRTTGLSSSLRQLIAIARRRARLRKKISWHYGRQALAAEDTAEPLPVEPPAAACAAMLEFDALLTRQLERALERCRLSATLTWRDYWHWREADQAAGTQLNLHQFVDRLSGGALSVAITDPPKRRGARYKKLLISLLFNLSNRSGISFLEPASVAYEILMSTAKTTTVRQFFDQVLKPGLGAHSYADCLDLLGKFLEELKLQQKKQRKNCIDGTLGSLALAMMLSLYDAAAFFDQTLHEPHDGPALVDCKRKLRKFLYTTPEGYRHDCLSALRLVYGFSTDQQLIDFLHSLEIHDQRALTRTFLDFGLKDPLKSDQAIKLEQWFKDCAAKQRELEINICGAHTNPLSPAEREEALFDDQDGPDTPPEQAQKSPQAEPRARVRPATTAADSTASVQTSTQADSPRAPQVAKPANERTPLANAHKPDKAATPPPKGGADAAAASRQSMPEPAPKAKGPANFEEFRKSLGLGPQPSPFRISGESSGNHSRKTVIRQENYFDKDKPPRRE